MNSPLPHDPDRDRTALVRKWAYLVNQHTYVPRTPQEFEQELLVLLDDLVTAVTSEPTGDLAAGVGTRLVELNCAGEDSFRSTMDVLGKGLPALPVLRGVDRLTEKVVTTLATMAAAYAAEVRRSTLEQQERSRMALLRAVSDARGSLAASEARFDKVSTYVASGIAITDTEARLVRANAALGAIVGYPHEELAGRDLVDLVHPEEAASLRADYRDLVAGRVGRIEQHHRLLHREGDTAWVSLTATMLTGERGRQPQVVLVVEDATEVMLLQSELKRQALHDPLTGLPNRQFFTTTLETVLRRSGQEHGVTLYHLDLDAFAVVSDGLGYQAGEQLLRHVSRRLEEVVATEQAVVARLGADEFAVLVENSPGTPDVLTMVAAFNEALAEPCYLGGEREGAGEFGSALSASIGIVHCPPPGWAPAELLRAADLALRRAKSGGRGQWELFHPDSGGQDREAFALAAAMPGAWESGEIGVRYRPVLRLDDESVAATEVLLSWAHPKLGTLGHERCAELAEDTGLILTLGEWLLRRGCQQVRWWGQQLGRDLTLTARLSPHQARDADLVARVLRVLADTGLPPALLELGMPAGTLAAGEEARDNLRVLAERGVVTAVRDIGGAAGELVALEDLPARCAWVAPWLVRRRAAAGRDTPSVRVLAGLGALIHEAGAVLVADGVDTGEQARWWLAAGADRVAGAFAGRPGEPDPGFLKNS